MNKLWLQKTRSPSDLERVPYLDPDVGHSAVAVSCPADATEDTLATITLPANTLGPNGYLEIVTLWTHTTSANNKTLRVRFGGTVFTVVVVTTSVTTNTPTIIRNRGATNSQVGFVSGSNSGFGTSGAAVITAAVDTTADVTILITGQKASAGEVLTLEGYSIKAYQ